VDDARLVVALEDALAKLGVPLRVEPLESTRGGLVRLRGVPQVLLAEHATPKERIAVLAAALAKLDTTSLFLAPAVRAAIERYG
jgi:hypothetical protein